MIIRKEVQLKNKNSFLLEVNRIIQAENRIIFILYGGYFFLIFTCEKRALQCMLNSNKVL